MENIKLSEHFSLNEFVASTTATKLHIDNTPTEQVVNNLRALCTHILEPLRQHVGTPVKIGSGYRCAKLNKAVGGVATSNHQSGCAADLYFEKNETGKIWFDWIRVNCDFDELIWETANKKHFWVHVAYRTNANRRKIIAYLVKK